MEIDGLVDNPRSPTYYALMVTSERIQGHKDCHLDQVGEAMSQLNWEQVP